MSIDDLLRLSTPLISVLLAISVPFIVWKTLKNRERPNGESKGIGWQFIRYTTVAISLPVIGLLALNDALTGEVATIIAGVMGYAFGKSDEKKTEV
jgi:carbon starvation protein CstA